jgi:hypothetical protein
MREKTKGGNMKSTKSQIIEIFDDTIENIHKEISFHENELQDADEMDKSAIEAEIVGRVEAMQTIHKLKIEFLTSTNTENHYLVYSYDVPHKVGVYQDIMSDFLYSLENIMKE